jgi:hypothetical protein
MTTEKTTTVTIIMDNKDKEDLHIIIAKQRLKGGLSALARNLLQKYIELHKDLV